MSQLCRLCLTANLSTVDLTEYRENLPISVLAMIILPVKIYDGENFNLPQKICEKCLEIVIAAYKLREISLKSETILKTQTDSIQIKNEISYPEAVFVDYENYPQIPSESCEYCNKEFNSFEELDNHITDEHFSTLSTTVSDEYKEGLSINCYKKDRTPKTSMVWRYFGKLYDQQNQQIGNGFHYCSICLNRKLLTKYKSTTATSTLIFHLNTVHGIAKDDNGPEKNFVKEKYSQRKERVLTTGPAVTATVCSECGKTFGNHHILKKHMKIHSGKFFPCDRCPAKFSYIENLYRHQRCHDPNHLSRYVCDNCGSRFAEMKSLKNHIMRVHLKISPPRKFVCTYEGCLLRFTAAFNLKKHMMTHTDAKPHQCQFCGNAYTSKGDLIKHLQKNHVGNAIYNCEHCTESFKFKVQLREHYKVHYLGNTQEEHFS